MISGSFGSCFNCQFLWHHLNCTTVSRTVHVAMIYVSLCWLLQLAVSLAPFACMADTKTGSCGNDLWQFWCLFQLAVSLAPCVDIISSLSVAAHVCMDAVCMHVSFAEQSPVDRPMTILVAVSIACFCVTICNAMARFQDTPGQLGLIAGH